MKKLLSLVLVGLTLVGCGEKEKSLGQLTEKDIKKLVHETVVEYKDNFETELELLWFEDVVENAIERKMKECPNEYYIDWTVESDGNTYIISYGA